MPIERAIHIILLFEDNQMVGEDFYEEIDDLNNNFKEMFCLILGSLIKNNQFTTSLGGVVHFHV